MLIKTTGFAQYLYFWQLVGNGRGAMLIEIYYMALNVRDVREGH